MWMLGAWPLHRLLPQPKCQFDCSIDLGIRYRSNPLVLAQIPLLPEGVQFGNHVWLKTEGQAERLEYPVVMCLTAGTVAFGCEGSRSQPPSRIVRDGQSPVRTQPRCLAVLQVSIDCSQQFVNLLRACPVFAQVPLHPPVG